MSLADLTEGDISRDTSTIKLPFFQKRCRFIEEYSQNNSFEVKKPLKSIVHTHPTRIKHERFHTNLILDTPPVGYYRLDNTRSNTSLKSSVIRPRLLDTRIPNNGIASSKWRSAPSQLKHILIRDDYEQKLRKELNQTLKYCN